MLLFVSVTVSVIAVLHLAYFRQGSQPLGVLCFAFLPPLTISSYKYLL